MDSNRIDALLRELKMADELRAKALWKEEFHHLERAHVLSQPSAWYHVVVHLRMFGWALRCREGREALGQFFRLLVAAPASVIGRFPVGSTGGSSVSAFLPMDIPEDLKQFCGSPENRE